LEKKEENNKLMNKETLKFLAIKERIAQITAEYEEKIADLRADFTIAVQDMNDQQESLRKENEELRAKLNETVAKED
jgi:predicted  nucleic acid-binding Zn-ribbon protein